MLLVVLDEDSINKFRCMTCPYQFKVNNFQIYDRKVLPSKEIDDVLGGEEAWANVDQTYAQCPQDCGSDHAYFFQLQIRSADEPMTTFLKCVKCAHQWREN